MIKDTKVCRVCKKEKSRKNDFYIRVPGKMYVSAACKECHVRIPKSQTPEAKAKRRASMRMWRLGVSQEEFDAKFESQGEACAICGSSDSRGSSWHTDHSHLTGEFRGVVVPILQLASRVCQ